MKQSLLTMLSALLLCISMLAAIIYGLGTSPELMHSLMLRTAPPDQTGLPAKQYTPMARMITSYLKGNGSFQLVFSIDGTEYAAFNQKEQTHMADVQQLFQLCSHVSLGSAILTLVGWLTSRRSPSFWRNVRRTVCCVLTCVTCLVLLACIDFNSLFILFHRIAFTNDLWLLDPSTDLLIRLMPIEFFVSYAAIIGGLWLLGMVALLVVSTISIRKAKKGSEIP
ncbi:MAG: TIGR01906 family membrane protein [Clostridia bacterium]|nr:TIGR01906 family membrane protein [Clostridia bacterium]